MLLCMLHNRQFQFNVLYTERIERIKERWGQLDAGLLHLYGQYKKAATRAVHKVRNDMEDEVYNKLEEDGGKMIDKLALDMVKDKKWGEQ